MTEYNNSVITKEEQEFLDSIGVARDDTENIPHYDLNNNEIMNNTEKASLLDNMRNKIIKSINYYQDNSGTLLYEDKNEEQWRPMDDEAIREFAGQFLHFENDELDLSLFDYKINDEDYYRSRFPHFPDDWYRIMAEASAKKIDDKRDKTFTRIDKPTTLSFS
tara:strand:- start:1261 stop:1749 length:489 start_codon:yes stop_codon:yes gene_type:complete